MESITTNKKAYYNYFILKKYSAGICLNGSEVKSIRAKNVNINESFVTFRDGEAFLHNMFIKTYEKSKHFVLDERRTRKLLLHKSEIKELSQKVMEKGLTVVPLAIFFEKNYAKVEIALAKGKLLYDKKDTIKKRDIEKSVMRELKNSK